MYKMTRAAFFAALCTVTSLALADADGTWTASFETQVGTQEYTFEFEVQGNVLTGMLKSNMLGENEIVDGKVDGSTITFVENGTYQGMPLTFTYTGEVGDDEISFTRVLEGLAAEEFVATRPE